MNKGLGRPPTLLLPYYLKHKKKFAAVGPMKKLNWKPIEPRNISKKSLWVACQGDTMVTEDIFTELSTHFSSKPAKIDGIVFKKEQPKIDFDVLDKKFVQSILIFKRASLKNVSNEQIKQSILSCEASMELIEGLIQCLPPADLVQRLCDLKKNADYKFSEAEEFVAFLGEVGELLPRLHSIRFKETFADMANELELNMLAATAACEEIKSSRKLAKIFELILTVGNFMNSGSNSIPAFGFHVSFITKITDTKDSDNKRTLLQFLVDFIQKMYPDLLSFNDEMPHLKRVLNVHTEKIQDDVFQITESLKELESILEKNELVLLDKDKFVESMGDFAMQCKEQLKMLAEIKNQMENSYKVVAEYFSFNMNEYPIEKFISDLNKFKQSFEQAYEENVKLGSNKTQASKKNLKMHTNQKQKTYPATKETIQKLCHRELNIKAKNMSPEGLCSYMFVFISI